MRITVTRKIAAASTSAILILLIGLVAFVAVRNLLRATARVEHAAEVIDLANNVLGSLKNAETGQRGFIITADSSYLVPYENAEDSAASALARLREYTAGNESQQHRLDTLDSVVAAKFAELEETMALRNREGFNAAAAAMRTDRGRELMDRARELESRIEAEERRFLVERGDRRAAIARRALVAIALGGVLSFLLALLLNQAIRRDVAEQIEARRQAEESQRTLVMQASVLDSMREGVSVSDENGTIVYTNPAEDRMFGYAPGELVGQHVSVQNRYPPDENKRIVDEVIAELRAHGEWKGEWENVRKDGTPFFTRSRITAAEIGTRRYWVCVQEDVTEQKREEARHAFLEEGSLVLSGSLVNEPLLEKFARHLVPFIADYASIDLLDGDGAIRRVETAHVDPAREPVVRETWSRYPYRAEDRLGVPQVIRTGEPIFIRDVPDDQMQAFARDPGHLELLRTLGPRSYICVPLWARGRAFSAISLVLADEACGGSGRRYTEAELMLARELARRAGAAIDNAQLYPQAEEATIRADEARRFAEMASQSKSDFLATMSHEIRTPINAIIGYTQLMEMGIAGSITDEQRDHLSRIGASGKHLLGLIDDILDLSRIEAGRMAVESAPGTANSSVDAALMLVRPQAAAKNITMVTESGTPDVPYIGDAQRVQQVLVNLLSNAVKFTPPAGRVAVTFGTSDHPPADATLSGSGPWTFIAVEDNGIGVAPGKLQRIFQPFVQGEGGYTRVHSGTGLGLTISRRLARLMHGDLTLESVQGEGATFTLWLPGSTQRVAPRPPAAVTAVTAGTSQPDHATGEPPQLEGWMQDRAITAGLAQLGLALRDNLGPIMEKFADRLRAEPEVFPDVANLSDVQLQNHMQTWLADVAQGLTLLQHGRGEPADMMRDGVEIQRMIAERHGAQRYQLGWSERAMTREFALLRGAIDGSVRSGGTESPGAGAMLTGLLRQAEEISLRSLRHAARTSPVGRG